MQYKIININDITDTEYNYFYSLMSDEKKARVDKFRFTDDKKRTIAGEMLARRMIADYCNIHVEDINFYTNEYGKPFAKNLDVEFNISHSYNLVICAVSDKPIGVDIEKIREIDELVISRVCTDNETNYVCDRSLSHQESLKRFFEIWTFKEAYFKCIGTGIVDLIEIDIFNTNFTHLNHIFINDYSICIYQE